MILILQRTKNALAHYQAPIPDVLKAPGGGMLPNKRLRLLDEDLQGRLWGWNTIFGKDCINVSFMTPDEVNPGEFRSAAAPPNKPEISFAVEDIV